MQLCQLPSRIGDTAGSSNFLKLSGYGLHDCSHFFESLMNRNYGPKIPPFKIKKLQQLLKTETLCCQCCFIWWIKNVIWRPETRVKISCIEGGELADGDHLNQNECFSALHSVFSVHYFVGQKGTEVFERHTKSDTCWCGCDTSYHYRWCSNDKHG